MTETVRKLRPGESLLIGDRRSIDMIELRECYAIVRIEAPDGVRVVKTGEIRQNADDN